jgi:hypothetical protein
MSTTKTQKKELKEIVRNVRFTISETAQINKYCKKNFTDFSQIARQSILKAVNYEN